MMVQRVRRKRGGSRAQPWGQRGALVSARGLQDRTRACSTRWQLGRLRCLHELGAVWLADGQDHWLGHQRHASSRQEVQLPHRVGRRGSKGPAKLQIDNYGHGPHACYNSWVILTLATTGTD